MTGQPRAPNRLNLPTRTPPSHPRVHSSAQHPVPGKIPILPLLRRPFRGCGFSGIFSSAAHAADLQNGNRNMFTTINCTQGAHKQNGLMALFTESGFYATLAETEYPTSKGTGKPNKLFRTLSIFCSWMLIINSKKLKLLYAPLQSLLRLIAGLGPASEIQSRLGSKVYEMLPKIAQINSKIY